MEKLGYKFIEYDVDNFVDGNIEFLTVINKEIDRVSAWEIEISYQSEI